MEKKINISEKVSQSLSFTAGLKNDIIKMIGISIFGVLLYIVLKIFNIMPNFYIRLLILCAETITLSVLAIYLNTDKKLFNKKSIPSAIGMIIVNIIYLMFVYIYNSEPSLISATFAFSLDIFNFLIIISIIIESVLLKILS